MRSRVRFDWQGITYVADDVSTPLDLPAIVIQPFVSLRRTLLLFTSLYRFF
ncbi:MAG: hypothetical protein NVSMB52_10730 [Chloroflexota bacterium]